MNNLDIVPNKQNSSEPPLPRWFNIFLWGLAIFLLLFTLHNVYLKFAAPNPYSDNLLASYHYNRARWFELFGNILLVCTPFFCGMYAALKNEAIRRVFPAVQILFLLTWNLMIFR